MRRAISNAPIGSRDINLFPSWNKLFPCPTRPDLIWNVHDDKAFEPVKVYKHHWSQQSTPESANKTELAFDNVAIDFSPLEWVYSESFIVNIKEDNQQWPPLPSLFP